MSRHRFIAFSSDYEPPMKDGFDNDIEARLQMLNLLDNPSPACFGALPKPAETQTKLARILSTKSVLSTTSSDAEERAKIHEKETDCNKQYRKIGAGACGAVFAVDGQPFAFKIGKMGTSDDDNAIQNDFEMHQRILQALRESDTDTVIPNCHAYINHDDSQWWSKHNDLAEGARDICHIPARVLITERVSPLPALIRDEIIDRFCRPHLRVGARADPANKDCLVRIYLGSMKGRMTSFFSLRNFKLHLNQMMDIGLDYASLAVSMGQALAIMHWKARTDARDVEFALGSSSMKQQGTANLKQREIRLFVIDFNQVRDISMDQDGVDRAVEAFFLNDPYYPRPRRTSKAERELWNTFVHSYLTTSDAVLSGTKHSLLPRQFISGVIERVEEKKL